MTFGEKVRNERNRLGLSQDELAEKIGVTRRVISSYENDSSRPRGTERYNKLADALGVNINYLLSEDEAFITNVEDNYGRRGAKQAKELLAEVTGLFAGGEMADEDMREMVDAIQEAYLIAKKKNMYIPFQVNHLHGQTEPVPRRMRATLTETEPVLFDVNYQTTVC